MIGQRAHYVSLRAYESSSPKIMLDELIVCVRGNSEGCIVNDKENTSADMSYKHEY